MSINISENDMTIETPWGGMFNYRVAFLIFKEDKILLHKSDEEYWFTPGGRVKFRENSLDAVKREIKEEIQTESLEPQFAGSIENFFTMDGKDYHELMFVYKIISPKDIIIPNTDYKGKEIISGWFSKEDINNIILKPTSFENRIFDFSEGTTHIIHQDKI